MVEVLDTHIRIFKISVRPMAFHLRSRLQTYNGCTRVSRSHNISTCMNEGILLIVLNYITLLPLSLQFINNI